MNAANRAMHKIIDWGKCLAMVAHFHGGPKYIARMSIIPLAGHDGIGEAGNTFERGGVYMSVKETG